jgi:ABC-type transporter Mla MlaB component
VETLSAVPFRTIAAESQPPGPLVGDRHDLEVFNPEPVLRRSRGEAVKARAPRRKNSSRRVVRTACLIKVFNDYIAENKLRLGAMIRSVGAIRYSPRFVAIFNDASLRTLFKPAVETVATWTGARLQAHGSLTFADWIPLKRRAEKRGDVANVTLDLSDVKLVDHTTMDKLLQTQREFAIAGRKLEITGLERHAAFGHTPSSGRKRTAI